MDPGAAAPGWSIVCYSYTDSTGCPNQTRDSVFLAVPATLSLNGYLPQFCSQDTIAYSFTGNLAPGGTVSSSCGCLTNVGAGAATFQPSAAPVGVPIPLTYTYYNGCTSVINYTTIVNASPTVTISGLPADACTGDSAFSITASDTSGAYSPIVTGITDLGNGTAVIDPVILNLGTYNITYTVSSGPCPAVASGPITINPLPNVAMMGLTSAYCADAPNATIQGNPPVNYVFGPNAPYLTDIGNGQALFIPSMAPLDTLIGVSFTHTSAAGCSATTTDLVIVHSLPDPVISGLDSAYCAGAAPDTLLGNFPSTGNWNNSSYLDSLAPDLAVLFPDSCPLGMPIWVTYQATNMYGCSAMDSAAFLVSALPLPAAGADTSICEGDSILIGLPMVQGQSYQWFLPNGNPGGTTPQTAVAPATNSTYMVHVTNAQGCFTDDSVTISVSPSPIVYAGVDDTICLGDSLILQGAASGYTTLLWNDGSGWTSTAIQPKIAPGQSSTYTLVVQGQLAVCADSDQVSISVVRPITNVDAGPDISTGAGEAVELQAIAPSSGIGTWSCPSGILQPDNPNSPNASLSNLQAGTWTMIWEVTNSPCPAQRDSILITVTELHFPTGFSPNGDGVNDLLVFAGLQLYAENRLQIFNRWGTMIVDIENYSNDWGGTNATGQPLPEDTYYYLLDLGDGQAVTRYLVLKRIPE
ncbi:MAG: gliding motility-associated C-terminal domain-containing protein [Bacteroidia bacterium]